MSLKLIDAPRCPYCARVRIVLAEKGLEHETVVIDLGDRPAWLYELNPAGKVPVIEVDGWVLAESAVINEYLEERHPKPPLLPLDPGVRAAARLLIFRHDDFATPYYAFRRGQHAFLKRNFPYNSWKSHNRGRKHHSLFSGNPDNFK